MKNEKVYHKWGTDEYYQHYIQESKTYEERYYWQICEVQHKLRKEDEVPSRGRVRLGTEIDWDANALYLQCADIEKEIVKARYQELHEERKSRGWYEARIISNWLEGIWPRNIYVVRSIESDTVILFTGKYGVNKMTKKEAKKNLKLGNPIGDKASERMWNSYDYSFTM